MINLIACKLRTIARSLQSSVAEKEVEKLLRQLLKGTKWANKLFAVGGYVRDEVLGLEAKDLDIVVDDIRDGAEKVTKWIHRQFPDSVTRPHQLGSGYPIWQITFIDDLNYKNKTYHTKGAVIEFADSMKESFPDENSRQRVTDRGTLKEDVERRDFTVNSLLKNLTNGDLRDLTGVSVKDIHQGVLRGNPGVDFDMILRQDPLRMIRLIRFQAKYKWKVPLSVLKTIKKNAKRIQIVSSERIMDELKKLGSIPQGFHRAVRLMKTTGLLKYILPEIDELRFIKQQPDERNIHKEGETVYHHVLEVLKHAKPTLKAQLVALLHDVGKKDTQKFVDNKIQFLGHEKISGEIAEAILRRLKFDKSSIKKIRKVVEHHMTPFNLEGAKGKSLRKFIREIGNELEDVIDIADADSKGNLQTDDTGGLKPHKGVENIRERLHRYRDEKPVVTPKPPLNGKEIMDLLNIHEGQDVGRAVRIVRDIVDEYGYDVDKGFVKRELIKKYS